MLSEFDSRPTGQLFDFCFLDAEQSYDARLAYCVGLTHFMKKDGYILCHDAYNQQTKRALQKACDGFGPTTLAAGLAHKLVMRFLASHDTSLEWLSEPQV